MKKHTLVYGMSLLLAALLGSLFHPLDSFSVQAQAGCQTFTQTGKQVCGRFLQYWQQNGGLAQQGLPLTGEFTEVSDLNGQSYTVQYFERAVFEKHPENAAPYDVLLSQLGTFQFKRKYPNGDPSIGQPQPTIPPAATQPPVGSWELKGRGQSVAGPITLKEGLAVFSLTHTNGTRNFIVELVDMSGKTLELLANDIGSVTVMSAVNIPASGAYLLKVRADGDWVISSTQPIGTYSSPPATQQWQGHGSFVTPLFSLKSGALRISGSHTNGTRNFIVELLDRNGETVELIANEIGPATINTIENVSKDGVFLLYIRADGDWTITLQQ